MHSIKIGIVMKQEKVIFDSRLGNQAIDCAINRYPLFAAFQVDLGGGGIGFFFILQTIESLRIKVSLNGLKIFFCLYALKNFLINEGANSEGEIIIEDVLKSAGRFILDATKIIDQNRSVNQDQSTLPPRRIFL